jgi:hypothetical protein
VRARERLELAQLDVAAIVRGYGSVHRPEDALRPRRNEALRQARERARGRDPARVRRDRAAAPRAARAARRCARRARAAPAPRNRSRRTARGHALEHRIREAAKAPTLTHRKPPGTGARAPARRTRACTGGPGSRSGSRRHRPRSGRSGAWQCASATRASQPARMRRAGPGSSSIQRRPSSTTTGSISTPSVSSCAPGGRLPVEHAPGRGPRPGPGHATLHGPLSARPPGRQREDVVVRAVRRSGRARASTPTGTNRRPRSPAGGAARSLLHRRSARTRTDW